MAGFLKETVDSVLVGHQVGLDEFDGHFFSGGRITRQQHDAHAAAAKDAENFKMIQNRQQARSRRRREHPLGDQLAHRPGERGNGRHKRRLVFLGVSAHG